MQVGENIIAKFKEWNSNKFSYADYYYGVINKIEGKWITYTFLGLQGLVTRTGTIDTIMKAFDPMVFWKEDCPARQRALKIIEKFNQLMAEKV